MAQEVKGLLCKSEDPSSDPRSPREKLVVVAQVCDVRSGCWHSLAETVISGFSERARLKK